MSWKKIIAFRKSVQSGCSSCTTMTRWHHLFLSTVRAFDLKECQQETGKDSKRHAWIEVRPPIRKERVSVHQVDTDEEYAKILQRKYGNEGGVQQVNNRCKVSRAMKTSKYRNLYRLKNLASSQS